MRDSATVPAVPPLLGVLLRPLPLLPLAFVLQRLADSLRHRRPQLFARLEGHADKVFLIDPTDLPFVFRLAPRPDRPAAEPCRREAAGAWDARVAGPFAALLGMVHGAYDGDALFFARDIVIEGDTEAVLALRNALDDAEIDMVSEAAAAFGVAGAVLETLAQGVLPAAARLTGLPLIRAG